MFMTSVTSAVRGLPSSYLSQVLSISSSSSDSSSFTAESDLTTLFCETGFWLARDRLFLMERRIVGLILGIGRICYLN